MSAAMNVWDKLREPFPDAAIGKLPKSTCRDCSQSQRKRCDQHNWIARCPECHGRHSSATIHLDYVGHAATSDRLLQADPLWTWEPVALDDNGLPKFDAWGGLWIRLTVHGDEGQEVTRLGYGDSGGKTGPNAVKEAIGDAIRNAAMRFGVAIDLWAKEDLHSIRAEQGRLGDTAPESSPAASERPAQTSTPTETAETTEDGSAVEPEGAPRHPSEASVSAQALADTAARLRTMTPLKSLHGQAVKAGLLPTEVTDKKTGAQLTLMAHIMNQKARIEALTAGAEQ